VRILHSLLLSLSLALPAVASAGEPREVGVGTSVAGGLSVFDPAPALGGEVLLPGLEISIGSPTSFDSQLRLRIPVLNTLWAGVVRRQLDLRLDVMWLATPCECPPDHHRIRPVFGPLVGLRLNAAEQVTQAGLAVGGRFGAEYVGPRRRFGLGLGVEPYFQFQGGPAGTGRTTLTTGGGGLVVAWITSYRGALPKEAK